MSPDLLWVHMQTVLSSQISEINPVYSIYSCEICISSFRDANRMKSALHLIILEITSSPDIITEAQQQRSSIRHDDKI